MTRSNWQSLLPSPGEKEQTLLYQKDMRIDGAVMGGGIIALIAAVVGGSSLWPVIGGLTLSYGITKALRYSGYGEWLP